MSEWVDGRRDYGDGWIGRAWTEEGGEAWFDLDMAVWDASIGPRLRGTPADCDLMHACIAAMRERPEALRAFLEGPAVPAGRTVRAQAYAFALDDGSWALAGGSEMDFSACATNAVRHLACGGIGRIWRGQHVVVDLLLPEEPPTVEGRVEMEPAPAEYPCCHGTPDPAVPNGGHKLSCHVGGAQQVRLTATAIRTEAPND